MIKNFDVLKEQLRELAGLINTFKSEAVQLRLIELVFEAAEGSTTGDSGDGNGVTQASERPRRRKPRAKSLPASKKEGAPVKSRGARPGGKAMLERIHSEGYFKKPRTIKQLVEHCEHDLAFKFKQSDFSGPLARLTRDGKLKRTKNADKQYEYSEA